MIAVTKPARPNRSHRRRHCDYAAFLLFVSILTDRIGLHDIDMRPMRLVRTFPKKGQTILTPFVIGLNRTHYVLACVRGKHTFTSSTTLFMDAWVIGMIALPSLQ